MSCIEVQLDEDSIRRGLSCTGLRRMRVQLNEVQSNGY